MIIHHDLQHARHFPDKRERTGLLLTLLQQNLRLSAFSFFPSSSFFYDRQPRHPPNSSFFGQENVNRKPPQVFWWGDSNLIFFSYKITISSPEGKNKIEIVKLTAKLLRRKMSGLSQWNMFAERFCQMFLDFIWRLNRLGSTSALSVAGDERQQSYPTDLLLLPHPKTAERSAPKVKTHLSSHSRETADDDDVVVERGKGPFFVCCA